MILIRTASAVETQEAPKQDRTNPLIASPTTTAVQEAEPFDWNVWKERFCCVAILAFASYIGDCYANNLNAVTCVLKECNDPAALKVHYTLLRAMVAGLWNLLSAYATLPVGTKYQYAGYIVALSQILFALLWFLGKDFWLSSTELLIQTLWAMMMIVHWNPIIIASIYFGLMFEKILDRYRKNELRAKRD